MNAPESTELHCSREYPGIAVITIDRPARRNALNLAAKRQLAQAIEELSAEDAIRVIVLTGANGVFVAGTDIREMLDMSPTDHALKSTDRVFTALRQCPKPLIAAVEGYAFGGGCELALACDLIILASEAKLGQPEIRLGIMPGAGATQRLLRTAGRYRSMKLLLTGESIGAAEALSLGLASEVAQDGHSLERALQLAQTIAAMPPLAVRAIKEAVQLGQEAPLATALQFERKSFQLLFDSEDQKEGMRAFLEKRKPEFRGR